MSSKRKRREARRRAKLRQQESVPAGAGHEETSPEANTGEATPQATPSASRPVHQRQRRKSRRGPSRLQRLSRTLMTPWAISGVVLSGGIALIAVLTLTAGSSGTSAPAAATPTPDPRVEGLPIDASFEIEAGDDGTGGGGGSFFQPDAVSADAGDVVEFVVTNTGSVTHNIWLAGADNEYDTSDDFGPIALISPGDTDRLVGKIDEPGTYDFKCQIHPDVQFGTLTLE